MPVVYIDVVWLINLILDGFILVVTVFLARRRILWWRTIGASAIGASYALFLFFPVLSIFLTFFFKFLFSVLMVWVAFKPKGLLDFGKMLGLFYLASFLTGGAAYAANNFFNDANLENGLILLNGGTVWLQKTTLALVALSLPIVYLLGKSAWKRLARSKQREQNFWTVDVLVGEVHLTFIGLLDTGNALTDPLSRLPVMVADGAIFHEVLPPALAAVLEKGTDVSLALGEIEMEEQWESRFRLVPYRGVGGSMGMLLAFRPDQVTLTGQREETHTTNRVLIGLNPKPLAGDGSYRAILHPSMIQADGEPAAQTATEPANAAASAAS